MSKVIKTKFFKLYGTMQDSYLGSFAVGYSDDKFTKGKEIKTLKDAKRVAQKMISKNANVEKVEFAEIDVFNVNHGGADVEYLYDNQSFIQSHAMSASTIALIFHTDATTKKKKGKGFVFTSSHLAEEAAVECNRIAKALRKEEAKQKKITKAKEKKKLTNGDTGAATRKMLAKSNALMNKGRA